MTIGPSMRQRLAADVGQAGELDLAPVVSGTTGQCFAMRCRDGQAYFLKTGDAARRELFAAEHEALIALAAARCVPVPRPVAHGQVGGTAYLLMQSLSLRAPTEQAERCMGTLLARQHRVTGPLFGWHRDNALGVNPQPNAPATDWAEFFVENRLRYQLRLASQLGHDDGLAAAVERLIERLPWFFRNYRPVPSLLHGDLWAGNWGMTETGEPVAFDPATYYGDREMDLAQTANGGFGPAFYEAYNEEWPIDPGFQHRRHLYNLYMVLNELNRVGRAGLPATHDYLEQVMQWIARHDGTETRPFPHSQRRRVADEMTP